MARRLSQSDLRSVVDESIGLLPEQEQEVSMQMSTDYGSRDGQRPREDGENEDAVDHDWLHTAEDGQSAPENIALEKCDYYVITPYFFLLGILGWRMFKPTSLRGKMRKIRKPLRVFLVIFWTLLIWATFSTQIMTCFTRDKISRSHSSSNDTELDDTAKLFVECKKHVITTYPTFISMIYLTYILGIYLFSHRGDRQITELAEKVFLLALKLKQNKNPLLFTMIAFLIGGAVWIGLALGLNIMTAVAFKMFSPKIAIEWPTVIISHVEKYGLITFSIIGFFTFDVVYIAAVINYAAQSEMIIDLLKAIKMLVEKGFSNDNNSGYENINSAMKDIKEARKFLRTLNGGAATSTAFILFNLGSNIVLSVVHMDSIINYKHSSIDYIHRDLASAASFLNVLLWLPLMVLPLVQAARVSYTCGRLKETGAFIYTNSNYDVQSHRQDMDMYSNFLQSLTLRATLFGVPIYPWMMYGTLTATVFVILILFQTDTYYLWYIL